MRTAGQTAVLWAFVLAGLSSVAILCWQVTATIGFLNRTTRAPGVIVEAKAHPWVAFTIADGTRIRFQQNGNLSGPEGTPVCVAYEVKDPQGTARVHSFWADWGGVFDILPVAGFFIAAMVLSLAGIAKP